MTAGGDKNNPRLPFASAIKTAGKEGAVEKQLTTRFHKNPLPSRDREGQDAGVTARFA